MTAGQPKWHSPEDRGPWHLCDLCDSRVERIGHGRGRDEDYSPPHRVAGGGHHPRLPQNSACRFPALRSSKEESQHCDILQLPIGKEQLRSHKQYPHFDLLENIRCDVALPAPAAEHSLPVAFHDPVDPPVRVRSPLSSAGALFGDFHQAPRGLAPALG